MNISTWSVIGIIALTMAVSLAMVQIETNDERETRNASESVCSKPPYNGSRALFQIGSTSVQMQFVYGVDTPQMIEMSKSCKMLLAIRKDGKFSPEQPTYDENGIVENVKFENLKSDTILNFSWLIILEDKNTSMNYSSPWQTQLLKTQAALNSSLSISRKTEDEFAVIWSWDPRRNFSHYYYRVEWIPLQCVNNSQLWGNGTNWIFTSENQLKINESDFPYSKITLFVNPVNHNNQTQNGSQYIYASSYIGVPDNAIKDVTCSEQKCYYHFEMNCYKQHGPQVFIRYKFSPRDPKLIKYEATAFQRPDSDQPSHVSLPEEILHYTEYIFSVTPANIFNVTQAYQRKTTYFRSPPKVPNKVEVLYVTSSETSVTVNWKDPPSWPPTGELEEFKLEWTYSKWFFKFSGKKIFNISDIQPVNGWYTYEIQDLKKSTQYTLQVLSKNIGVDTWNASEIVKINTINGKPSQPRTFDIYNKSSSSLAIKILPPKVLTSSILYYNINISSKGLLPQYKNISFNSGENIFEWDGLKEGTEYSLGAQACTSKTCGDWTLNLDAWTLPQPIFQNEILLVVKETTKTQITVFLQKETYHGNWSRYVIAEKQMEAAPNLTIDMFESAKPDHPFYSKGVWVILLGKDFVGRYTLKLNHTGRSFRFASAMLVYTDEVTLCTSNFTEYFAAVDVNVFMIVYGFLITLAGLFIVGVLICCVRRRMWRSNSYVPL